MKAFLYLSRTEGEKGPLGPANDGMYPLDDQMRVVGRLGDIRVPVWAKKVSRFHLLLAHDPEHGLFAVDCAKHGSFLNGERLQRTQRLNVGDVLSLPNNIWVEIVS